MSIEVNPKSTLDLLKRLEGKGVPWRVSSSYDTLGGPFCNLWLTEFYSIKIVPDGSLVPLQSWQVIGCIVEYMESQGWRFHTTKGRMSYQATFFIEGDVSEEGYAETLLTAVLKAADRALT